jgi:hypothetical protein
MVLQQNKAPHITKDSILLSIFILFSLQIMKLSVEHKAILSATLRHTKRMTPPPPDKSIEEINLLLSITHFAEKDTKSLLIFTTTVLMIMCSNNTQQRFFHTLKFLHFVTAKTKLTKKVKKQSVTEVENYLTSSVAHM